MLNQHPRWQQLTIKSTKTLVLPPARLQSGRQSQPSQPANAGAAQGHMPGQPWRRRRRAVTAQETVAGGSDESTARGRLPCMPHSGVLRMV